MPSVEQVAELFHVNLKKSSQPHLLLLMAVRSS